jgi:hypothetical protein
MKPLAYTLSAEPSEAPLKGHEASDQKHVGVTNVARQRLQENPGFT